MSVRAAPSPAWLGVVALASFGGLVLASFASGYHLAVRDEPRAAVSSSAASSSAASSSAASSSAASSGAASSSAVSGGGAESSGAGRAASAGAAQTATVRQHLDPQRGVVRSKPDARDVVARLPAEQRVTLLERQGRWCRIEYRRGGKTIAGWTDEANLSFP